MVLIVDYTKAKDRTLEEDLDLLDFDNALPKWFYTKSELATYRSKRVWLLQQIMKDEEYYREWRRDDNSCRHVMY